MFFNYDSYGIVAIAFIVTGILIQSLYKSNALPNDSLVNTNSSLDSISKLDSNIQLDQLPNHSFVDASIQTANIQVEASIQTANTYVNTGMQTSSRMWLESIRNWITEILGSGTSNPNPQATGQYVDIGVQTNATSMWDTVKQWFLDVCSVRGSELSSMGHNKVAKWRNKLDDIQEVSLQDSESPLTTFRFGTDSPLQNLVDPNDSASNISEVVSESSLHVPSNSVYDIYNQEFFYESLNNVSNHIDYNYVINGATHTVLVIADKILTVDPNIIVNPFIC
jgi:hypothetical protein